MRSDASSYVSGAEVGVQLRAGARSVGYNLCFAFARLEQHDRHGGWAPVDVHLGPPSSGNLVVCTAEMRA